MQIKAIELVPRCTHCYGDSPKAFMREQVQPMGKASSEYQAAYKHWPWHPRPSSMKPEQKKLSTDKTRSHMERKSTYGLDFVMQPFPKTMAPKKHKTKQKTAEYLADDTHYKVFFPKKAYVSRLDSPVVENAEVIHPSNNQPFQGDTIYSAAYTKYEPAAMRASKQPIIKGKDNIETASMADTEVLKSTAQDDFVHHKEVDRPVAIRPMENTERPTEPIDESTEYKDFYTVKSRDAHMCKTKLDPKFEAISTAMADFIKPENFEKPIPCPPPVSDHFVTGKFDGTTTFNMAYKPFPVKRYELPIWAKKPTYKRPKGGMITNSLYMHDYRDPEVVKRPAPMKPSMYKRNVIIKNDKTDRKFEDQSTYKKDFRIWEDVHPRESYRIIEIYQPPKEKMVCETNQRSHFTGVKADKMKPCRHRSQHRELNTDSVMTFETTYTENFQNPRPKSTPSSGSENQYTSVEQRAYSAGLPNTSKSATPNKIPTPDLSINFYMGTKSEQPETATNNSAVKAGQGHVDILKITHTCDRCKEEVQTCECEQDKT